MEDYLGEYPVTVENTVFAGFDKSDWALHWILRYGGINGEHHILHGTTVVVTQAMWKNGHKEFRFKLSEPSEAYLAWVSSIENEDCVYDTGIAP